MREIKQWKENGPFFAFRIKKKSLSLRPAIHKNLFKRMARQVAFLCILIGSHKIKMLSVLKAQISYFPSVIKEKISVTNRDIYERFISQINESSANITTSVYFEYKSLNHWRMSKTKMGWPNIEPCGTPHMTDYCSDTLSPKVTISPPLKSYTVNHLPVKWK